MQVWSTDLCLEGTEEEVVVIERWRIISRFHAGAVPGTSHVWVCAVYVV